MDKEFNRLYNYDLEMHSAYLASFLWNIQKDRRVGTAFKLSKITIIKQCSQYKMIHLIKFRTNLTIDELCHFFNLSLYCIRYTSPNRQICKKNRSNLWALFKKNRIIVSLLNNSEFFKHYNETNVFDMFNLQRAYRYNTEVCQLIEQHYYKRNDIHNYFTCYTEFNLNELLIKLNLSQISIFDVEDLLKNFGEHFKKLIIDNFELIVPISFVVRRKVNLILCFIARYCPKIEEIVIDLEHYTPLKSSYNYLGGAGLAELCILSLSIYAGENEVERLLNNLHKADILFHVAKIKNLKLKCNKKIKKLMKLNFLSKRAETLILLSGLVKPEHFPTLQIAFEWHQESSKSTWKAIQIINSYQTYISYMFTEINLLKYYNLFDLLFLDDVFYDIKNFEQHLIYYQILLLRPSLVNSITGEFNLNKILLNLNSSEISLKSLLKVLRIFGSFIKIFVASKNLIDFSVMNLNSDSIFKIVLYYLYKYCKNLETIKFDDTILESKQFLKAGKVKLKNLLVTNYNANDLFEIFNHSELQINKNYNQINIKKFMNLNELDFIKTLQIKNISKIILNSNYTNIINWTFLQDTENLKLDTFYLENTFEIKLYHLIYNPYQYDSACDNFLEAVLKFFIHFNMNKNFKLNLDLVECTIKSFTLFNYLNLERIVFNRINLTSTNLIELGQCYNLKSVTFVNCDKLTDEYLIVFIKELDFKIKEINVESCLISNAFFYQFAAHEIDRFQYRIFKFWFSSIKFSFKNCPQITIDWEEEEFVISNDDTYISLMDEFDEHNCEPMDEENQDLLDYEDYYEEDNISTNENSNDIDEEIGYDFYN